MRAGTGVVDAMSGVDVCCSWEGGAEGPEHAGESGGEEGGGVGSVEEADAEADAGLGGWSDERVLLGGASGAKTTRALRIRSARRSPTHFWAWM